ncbi:MAG: SDR family NAD(P)-dependent oxidoreductase, partial [Oscillospiraceae bacterium]|nr:SDR family NAD(P)-dependent oxidoreductase [Oscillospiraceae bacterium]
MSNTKKNIAIILAGGSGKRCMPGGNTPKQFFKVAGKSVIEHTIDVFDNSKVIDEIAVVTKPEYHEKISDMIIGNSWEKVTKVLDSGEQRYDSSLSAIAAYADEENANLFFHDAVRPLVTDRILQDVDAALENYEAVDVCISATDTIVQGKEIISNVPDRKLCWQGQTPQAFRLATIKKAYDKALKDPNFSATDDCGVVNIYLPEVAIKIVQGERQNIKLTYIDDLYLLDKLFQLRSQEGDLKKDLSRLNGKVIVVFGGSQGIGKEMCDMAREHGAAVYSFTRTQTGTDITNPADIKNALAQVHKEAGKIDYIVNTAGMLEMKKLSSVKNDKIDSLIDVNYKGVVYVAKYAFPYLKETKGMLLNFTSSSYTYGRELYSLYSSSKAAVVNFVQAISKEWLNDGVCANCINPERT